MNFRGIQWWPKLNASFKNYDKKVVMKILE